MSLGVAIAIHPQFGSQGAATEPELPQLANLLGDWYAVDYDATPRPVIPNRQTVATTPVSQYLNPAPRRLFSNTQFFATFGTVTVTDDAATAPDGTNQASTLNASGNWLLGFAPDGTYTAGTYTIAVNAKRNTGSDQQFCFTKDNTGTRSSVKTATSAWQRFSYTYTLASTTNQTSISICSIDGSTAANLQICDLEIYPGSSDLGPATYAGHLYTGLNAQSAVPTYAAGALDLSTGGWGVIQLAANVTTTDSTAMACVSKVAAGSSFHGFLSKIQAYTDYSALVGVSLKPYSIVGGVSTEYDGAAGLWQPLDQGYHVITQRQSSGVVSLWLDDILLFSTSAAASSYALRDFYVGLVNSSSLPCGEKMANMALWNVALSDSEVRQGVSVLRAAASSAGLSPADARIYCAEGDSITATGTPTSYAYLFGPNASPDILGNNFAVSASTLADLNTRATTVDAVIPPTPGTRKFILSVLIGANDLGSYVGGAAAYLTDLAAYCDARRAAGWLVCICTITPQNNAGFNTRRGTVNTAINASWLGVHADALANFAGDANYGQDADAANAAKYPDGVHPVQAGQDAFEVILRAAINGL